jgi:hypothetical protein
MKYKTPGIYLCYCLFLTLCFCREENKNPEPVCDCAKLRTGILTANPDLIAPEIDTLRSTDREVIVDRVNQCDSLVASSTGMVIITNPAIFEIRVSTDSSGIEICRILDLVNRDGKRLRYVNMHLQCFP